MAEIRLSILRRWSFIPVSAVFLSAFMILSGAIAVADSVDSANTTEPTIHGNLRIGYTQMIDSLNPYVGLNEVSTVFYGLVYDCLQSADENGNVVPNLARDSYPVPTTDPEMTEMPYGSVWQYNLTRDAYWSDGTPFTADDVVFNIELALGPQSTYSMWWPPWPCAYFIQQAWKVDNYTVRISFWNRATLDPQPTAFGYWLPIPMLPKHLLEQLPGGTAYIGMSWTGIISNDISPGMPIVGTGPFVPTSSIYSDWVNGENITLMRNPAYHQTATDGKMVGFERLTMKFFQNTADMVIALKGGEIDVAAFPPQEYNSIKREVQDGTLESVDFADGPMLTGDWSYLGFCMGHGGSNPSRLDSVVRQAIHMATNKDYIVDQFYLGMGEAATTIIPPVSQKWHYEPNETENAKFTYNLSAAGTLLEENGYIDIDSDGVRECTIASPAVREKYVAEGQRMAYELLVRKEHPEEKDTAMYLKSQWSQIGVVADIKVVEEITMLQLAFSYNYDSLIWSGTGDIDPNTKLFMVTRGAWSGWSDCKYYNADYDEAYGQSVRAMDTDVRESWVDSAQRIFYNDSAYVLLSYIHQGYAWRTDDFTGWGNWSAHPGRTIDNYWSANPLVFDLESTHSEPVDDGDGQLMPVAAMAAGGLAVVAAVVTLIALRTKRLKQMPPTS